MGQIQKKFNLSVKDQSLIKKKRKLALKSTDFNNVDGKLSSDPDSDHLNDLQKRKYFRWKK